MLDFILILLSREGFRKFNLGSFSDAEFEAVLEAVDFDGDGKMNFREFVTVALAGK